MDKVILTCIFVTLALVHGRAQSAPSPAEAPAPTTDCSSLIYDMMDCMAFLTSGGNETKPDESCCLGVKTVVDANPECVCYALSVGVSLGLNLNMTKASILSSACAISVPPLSNCNIDISPVATPELSPEPSPMASPVNPPALSPPSQPNLPPTTEPPTTTPVPGGAPATPPTADAGVTVTPASAQKKNGSSTISATFSVVFALLISFFLKPLA